MTTGIAQNKATNSVVLNGVKNGDATWVAIIVEPSGSWAINGSATIEKICWANGTRQMNMTSTDTPALTNRERSSIRCEISEPSSS